jgi:hypothetical protein
VKPVKAGSFIVQAARYLGALTRCKSLGFPWVLRLAPSELRVNRVLVQGRAAIAGRPPIDVSLYKFPTGHSRKGRAARIRAVNIEL